MNKEIMDIKECCDDLGLKRTNLYKLVKENKIPFFQIGKLYKFSRTSLLEWATNKINEKLESIEIDTPQFDSVGRFSEGLARVEKSGKWGYIDATEKIVIDYQFDWAGDFYEGIARVKKDSETFQIDKEGKRV